MPDLMVVPMSMCKSNEEWERKVPGSKPGSIWTVRFDRYSHITREVDHDFSCDCPAYQYGKGKYCKHIKQVKDEHCGWHEQFDGDEAKNGKCPRCGGEAVRIMVGI